MRFHHHYPICLFLSIVLISFTGCKKKDMSLKMNEPRNIKGVISYKRSFGDLTICISKQLKVWESARLLHGKRQNG